MARKLLEKWIGLLAVTAALAASEGAAHAGHSQCAERGEVVAHLSEKYQESQFASGTIGQTAVMEVFVGKTGSWTMVITGLDGVSCIVAAGENWENSLILSDESA
jgi:hypothetical protein